MSSRWRWRSRSGSKISGRSSRTAGSRGRESVPGAPARGVPHPRGDRLLEGRIRLPFLPRPRVCLLPMASRGLMDVVEGVVLRMAAETITNGEGRGSADLGMERETKSVNSGGRRPGRGPALAKTCPRLCASITGAKATIKSSARMNRFASCARWRGTRPTIVPRALPSRNCPCTGSASKARASTC